MVVSSAGVTNWSRLCLWNRWDSHAGFCQNQESENRIGRDKRAWIKMVYTLHCLALAFIFNLVKSVRFLRVIYQDCGAGPGEAAGTLCSLPLSCVQPLLPGCGRRGSAPGVREEWARGVNVPCAHKWHVLALMTACVGKHEYRSATNR